MSTSTEEGTPGHILGAARRGDYSAARVIARNWHGGSDHNITGLSHGCEWSTPGLVDEVRELLGRERSGEKRKDAIAELEALLKFALDHAYSIVAVWSSYGHRFMGEDGLEKCLTCGAEYELVHDSKTDLKHGRYRNRRGEDPTECIGWGEQRPHGEEECPVCHGDPMETSGDIECRSCDEAALKPCNCIRCTS